ncbi:Acyl-coenzyme A thioesterase 8 [Durusdinium trenchii]|uniref:Acyl-coenzyme A thioesterase 8 n=1 Tax=Durusdinium trenchii TaxID=1381693 RepID=A0ABP0K6W4_9DINO
MPWTIGRNRNDEGELLVDGRKGAPGEPPHTFHAIVLDKIDPNLYLARPENLWKPPFARAVFGGQAMKLVGRTSKNSC